MIECFYVIDYCYSGVSDTEAVKMCLRDASAVSPRTVVFNQKDYVITEAITLASGTTVIIEDCTVKLADRICDNLFRGGNVTLDTENPMGMPISCEHTQDIKILGKGNAIISGPDKSKLGFHPILREIQPMVGDFWGFRTHLISLSRCNNFEVSGLFVKQTCGWAMCFDLCLNGHIHDIVIESYVKNGDGIDFRTGCHYCLAERIRGTTSDDTVAMTAIWSSETNFPCGNYLYPSEPGYCIKERSEEERSISHITVRDINTNGRHHAVICLAACGCKIHHIHIENISETPCTEWRESVIKLYTGYGSGFTDGDMHHITLKNINAVYANYTVSSNIPIHDIVLKNISHPNPEKTFKTDYKK